MDSVFSYMDYREILRNELSRRARQNPRYSQGAFARDLNLRPSRLSEILSGKQGISLKIAEQIAETLRFNHEESSYFGDLVVSVHGRSKISRESARLRLIKYRKPDNDPFAADDTFKVISEWYHLAIVSLTKLDKFQNSIEWIASVLGIEEAEAEEAVSRLVRLGVLEEKDQTLVATEPYKSICKAYPADAFAKFNRQILCKAYHQVDNAKGHQSAFNYTLAFDGDRLAQVQSLLKEAMETAVREVESVEEKNVVYCLSTQLFPLMDKIRQDKHLIH